MNALRAFEAAGRLESLTDAATELNVTPAAVGHQVKALESYFDQALFERRYRAIALTEKGRLLLAGVTDGFDRLSESVDAFAALEQQRALIISSCTSFAARWLVHAWTNSARCTRTSTCASMQPNGWSICAAKNSISASASGRDNGGPRNRLPAG